MRPPYHPLLTQSRELTTTTTGKKRTSPYMLPGPRCLYRVTVFDSHQTRSTCWPNRRRNVSPLIGKRGLRVCIDACASDFFFFLFFLFHPRRASVQRLFSKYYIKLEKTRNEIESWNPCIILSLCNSKFLSSLFLSSISR